MHTWNNVFKVLCTRGCCFVIQQAHFVEDLLQKKEEKIIYIIFKQIKNRLVNYV